MVSNIVNPSIDRLGENITVRVVSVSISDWGDNYGDNSTSDTTTVAVVNDIQGDEEFNTEGKYHPGDKTFFVKSDASVSVGNRIIHNSNTYEVKDVITHRIKGNNVCSEVRTNKV
jgi:hypothetical protein